MAQLINKKTGAVLLSQLKPMTSLRDRTQGLIGTRSLPDDVGYWFPRCNWIHTLFMSMSIDVIYLDQSMTVKKVQKDLKPWRLPLPVLSAHSVVEMAKGRAHQLQIEKGDSLHVGH